MKRSLCIVLLLLLCAIAPSAEARNLTPAERRRISYALTRIVQREVPGASARITEGTVSGRRIRLEATDGLAYYPMREESVAAIYDTIRELLPPQMRRYRIELRTEGRTIEELVPLPFRSKAARRRETFTYPDGKPLVTPLSRPYAAPSGLDGKHIALWGGHGRYFDQKENRWRWQRSKQWMTCEDLCTQSYVLPLLVPMLERAGARVLLPRERDTRLQELIADNDAGIDCESSYRESCGEHAWYDAGVGFAHLRSVYRTGENPFREGSVRAVRTVTRGAESFARWSVTIPQRDDYAVYVSYATLDGSTDDARYTVHHAGGQSTFSVNQSMGGGTWIYLGTFTFERGEQLPAVTLTNRSDAAGRIVTADAVKIGGGYGNIARTVCDSMRVEGGYYEEEVSGYPRYSEGARYWLQWAGFDTTVYAPHADADDYKDDYKSRGHWVNALMGGSARLRDSAGLRIPVDLSLAFHTDAGVRPDDRLIGTLGIFFTQQDQGLFEGGVSRYLSRDLTDAVTSQVIEDIRRTCEPLWPRRGLWNRSYYEVRVPAAPSALLELLSHQNFSDMRYGKDPRFRFLAARAVYKGILRHVAAQYGYDYVVQPLPVESFRAEFDRDHARRVILRWRPVVDSLEPTAAAQGYVVYTRKGDAGFDNGRYVTGDSLGVEQEPGIVYSYRVTAVNRGGESFPSQTLAACRMPDERGCVLIVNGFERVSAPLHIAADSVAGFYTDHDSGVPYLSDVSFIGAQRIFDRRLYAEPDSERALGACDSDYETDEIGGNTFDYAWLHGTSVARAGYSFCSSGVRAVAQGQVALRDYDAVDLILGKQRRMVFGSGFAPDAFEAFPDDLQCLLADYTASGGSLLVSGCYPVTDLLADGRTTPQDSRFAREVLHVAADGSGAAGRGIVRAVSRRIGGMPDNLRFSTTPARDFYAVEKVDALRPAGNGAFVALRYADANRAAAVAFEAEGEGKRFVMGFPFEQILSERDRDRLMESILRFFGGGSERR